MSERAMGKAKEAYDAIIGDEAKKAEGRAQQRKAEAEEETRWTKAEAKQAEKERDRQRRKDSRGLGGLTDTLTGL